MMIMHCAHSHRRQMRCTKDRLTEKMTDKTSTRDMRGGARRSSPKHADGPNMRMLSMSERQTEVIDIASDSETSPDAPRYFARAVTHEKTREGGIK